MNSLDYRTVIFSNMPQFLQPYFWDIHFRSLDIEKQKNFIIARILEKGRIECIVWLFKTYAISDIQRIVQGGYNLSLATKRFAAAIIASATP